MKSSTEAWLTTEGEAAAAARRIWKRRPSGQVSLAVQNEKKSERSWNVRRSACTARSAQCAGGRRPGDPCQRGRLEGSGGTAGLRKRLLERCQAEGWVKERVSFRSFVRTKQGAYLFLGDGLESLEEQVVQGGELGEPDVEQVLVGGSRVLAEALLDERAHELKANVPNCKRSCVSEIDRATVETVTTNAPPQLNETSRRLRQSCSRDQARGLTYFGEESECMATVTACS